ncbi:aldo/keto reductase [Pseudonocardia sp. MH-G8]|uniref:aldo/keto reductase n=1 Tax=Pseudonocardia sp. MH-G8 TaxID=1854588 RepID=UPI000BA13324|nr:aldo/keto reductase [Pseudonocardia sp. MH-G8]OZM75904.1 oxidoreductase [Pseudonocardia sp. MH-G8]
MTGTTMPRRPLGGTGLQITPLTIGGGPLGSMPGNLGYEVSADRGVATAVAALTGPVNALDTSNSYSGGESERRIGEALRQIGGIPEGYVLSTKVDRDLDTGEFSGDQVRRSIEASLARLGVDRVPLLHLHDPEHITFDEAMAPGGPVEVLVQLRDEGVAGSIGVAGGPVDLLRRFVATGAFDAVLTHNRWTLVNRAADPLLDEAAARGMGVVNAAVFGGGILAAGTRHTTRYAYRECSPALLAAVHAVEQLCAGYGVPLAAAAVQFSTRDPRIATTVLGVSRPERVAESVELATCEVPEQLWSDIDEVAARLSPDQQVS